MNRTFEIWISQRVVVWLRTRIPISLFTVVMVLAVSGCALAIGRLKESSNEKG